MNQIPLLKDLQSFPDRNQSDLKRLQQEKKALNAEADHLAQLFCENAAEPAPKQDVT